MSHDDVFPRCIRCGEPVEWLESNGSHFWRHTAGWVTCFNDEGDNRNVPISKATPGERHQSVLL